MTDVIFQEGNDIMANNIGPVLNYEDGEITEFTIINNAENEQQAKFYLDISEISNSLKEESFKYVLQISTDGTNYTTYKDGNFVNANTGELIISDGETLPSGKTYYKFIIYIDGNMNNPTSMMNNSLKATLNVEIISPTITVAELVNQMKSLSVGPRDNYTSYNVGSVYETEDDYGTSYYLYRGNKTNYIENDYKIYFANSIWEILRINGNDSLRLILNTTTSEDLNSNYANYPYTSFGSEYNSEGDDYAYVGYMYGQVGASSYEEAHANINDSTVKQKVDNWYKTNIEDQNLSKYIEEDTTFCNDRSNVGYGSVSPGPTPDPGPTPNDFLCPNINNDGFSVANATKGNKALTYPIALATYNEKLITTGNKAKIPCGSLSNVFHEESTMTPGEAGVILMWQTAVPVIPNYNGEFDVRISRKIRPVISLKTTTKLTLSNTYYNTYEVVYE